MMGEEASEEVASFHAGGGGAGAGAGEWESGSTWSAAASSSSGIGMASSDSSSIFSSVGDGEEDGVGATSASSARPADRRRRRQLSSLASFSSSTSSESEASQMDAADGGPLDGMSAMRDHLPPGLGRSGLSMYYQGRSESFTSLAVVSCVEDLAKKTTPYIRRPRHAAALGVKNRLPKTVAKKAPTCRKPSTASKSQGKRELYRC